MDLGLQGAKVLVTAASAGLGAATAERFSQEGASVVISSRSMERLQVTALSIAEKTGNPVFAYSADVTQEEAVQQLIERTQETLGGLDVLVTNAGGPPAGTFEDFAYGDWRSATDLTLLSAVTLIRHALPRLKQSERAAVLAIVSVAAKQPVENLTLSNVIRPAVVGLTKTLSLELGAEGIRFNSILSGVTDTERINDLMQARAARNDSTPEAERQKAAQAVPLGRIGTPEEFANAAVFLCSPAGGFINGTALAVDGGAIRTTF